MLMEGLWVQGLGLVEGFADLRGQIYGGLGMKKGRILGCLKGLQ